MSRNQKLLESFTVYCKQNPDQRFWQALRNWCGWPFMYASTRLIEKAPHDGVLKDTFYWEGNEAPK